MTKNENVDENNVYDAKRYLAKLKIKIINSNSKSMPSEHSYSTIYSKSNSSSRKNKKSQKREPQDVEKPIKKIKNRKKRTSKQCEICGSLIKDMASHKLTHLTTKEELYLQCDICGKKFLGKSNILQHLTKTHLGYKFVIILSFLVY